MSVAPPIVAQDLHPASLLGPDSHLTLRPLSVVAESDGYLVGDPQTGIFLALPEVGVVALRVLQAGGTIAQAAVAATEQAGQALDVLDFAAALIESGLVAAVDGTVLGPESGATRGRSWLAGVRPGVVRPFFSRAAWALYGLLFVACLGLFLVQPQYWPSFKHSILL